MSSRSVDGRLHLTHRLRRRIAIILVILVLALAILFTDSYLSPPRRNEITQPISHTTSLFPTDQEVHINDSRTTGIIVDITGDTLSNSTYFTVTTTNSGLQVPKDVSPLSVGNTVVAGYFDVKVTTNMTLTPEVKVKITITNSNFNQNSAMYYWYATAQNWVSVVTNFQSPHTVIGTIEALYLTGTPIGIGNGDSTTPSPTATTSTSPTPTNSPSPTPTQSPSSITTPSPTPTSSPSPTITPSPAPTLLPVSSSLPSESPSPSPLNPPLVAPEYAWGTLLALLACFGALALFKTRNAKRK